MHCLFCLLVTAAQSRKEKSNNNRNGLQTAKVVMTKKGCGSQIGHGILFEVWACVDTPHYLVPVRQPQVPCLIFEPSHNRHQCHCPIWQVGSSCHALRFHCPANKSHVDFTYISTQQLTKCNCISQLQGSGEDVVSL